MEENLVKESGATFDLNEVLRELEGEMATAAGNLEYEKAALLRDQISELDVNPLICTTRIVANSKAIRRTAINTPPPRNRFRCSQKTALS